MHQPSGGGEPGMSKLVLFLADGTTLDVPLKRERMTIGRRADNDICLPNLAVSGEHAAVVTLIADSFLEDLGSTNGTLVNAAPIAKHFLRDGDQIDIGRHILVFCVDDDAVLSADFVRAAVRTGIGDLGEQVETAKPFVRKAKTASGRAMRRERAAENAAADRTAAMPANPPRVPAAANPASGVVAPPAASAPALRRNPSLKVLSGAGEGQLIPLAKAETSLGRAGIQVAIITRRGESFRLRQIEGERPVQINGSALAKSEVELATGDVIEVVGRRLEFVGMPQVVISS
jgi:pSer/pThr/pTyr-binding forkhead associated (FHA) protein